MIPFLYNVANTYFKIYGNNISRYTFVFPSQRAGVFFQYYLTKITKQPIFSPEIVTVSDLFLQLTGYQKADRIDMLFLLYEVYKEIGRTQESFDEFLYWGEMLLNDFDDVDKYLVDAEQLFSNIYDLKEIDSSLSYLTEDQIEAIRRFWSSFLPIGDNEKKKDFAELWEVLCPLYTKFREKLREKGQAYEGMIFREVVENIKQTDDITLPFEKIIFVGLNGHSTSEEYFLSYLNKKGIADFYWDYSSPIVCDSTNKASHFIPHNRQKFPSKHQLEGEMQSFEKPTLELIGVPSAIGQAKYIHSILNQLIKDEQSSKSDKVMNTALVLPDENLLLPVLYSIPESIDKVNVTMGYSLHNSSVSGIMEHIFELQRNVRFSDGQVFFYHKPVLSILNHKYVTNIAEEEAKLLKENIVKYNKILVSAKELAIHPLFTNIFKAVESWYQMPEYLKEILAYLKKSLGAEDKLFDDKEETVSTKYIDVEGEFIVEYYKTINKMQESLRHTTLDMSIDTYAKLLKKLIQSVSVPFRGEPLSGLQVMGVLETRALDFDNIIITSMNEGVFPMSRATNSFIPYNLRKGFQLPTYEHQDSIYAYHFYRLINRAKRIYFLYDTRTEGMQSGEVSRYYNQIKHLYADYFDIKEQLATYKVSSEESIPIAIEKTEQIQNKMKRFLDGGDGKLSASAINTYLDCPLQFYFSFVEKLGEVEEVSESIESSTFGTIFHSVMEWLYEPLKEKLITADLLDKISNDNKYLTQLIERSFAENYFMTPDKIKPLTGQNFLTGEVIRKYVKKLLSIDAKITPFIYKDSEERINEIYPLQSGLQVRLTGIIDRVDEVKGSTRIIDYKTGRGVLRYKSMKDLFDKETRERPKAVMQVFMYAHLYLMKHKTDIVESGIYYLRNLYESQFDPAVIFKPTPKDNIRITDFSTVREEFSEHFDACLEEIFDSQKPFTQTTTGEACQWCVFTNICKK